MESIASLLKPFIDKDIVNNIELFSKVDSPAKLNSLFETPKQLAHNIHP
jgi:hypothetical protein